MTTLTHPRQRPGSQIVGLLTFIGVPREMLYVPRSRANASFWRRPINFLAILETAKRLFRKRARQLAENARYELIRAYRTVQARFKEHGYELER